MDCVELVTVSRSLHALHVIEDGIYSEISESSDRIEISVC